MSTPQIPTQPATPPPGPFIGIAGDALHVIGRTIPLRQIAQIQSIGAGGSAPLRVVGFVLVVLAVVIVAVNYSSYRAARNTIGEASSGGPKVLAAEQDADRATRGMWRATWPGVVGVALVALPWRTKRRHYLNVTPNGNLPPASILFGSREDRDAFRGQIEAAIAAGSAPTLIDARAIHIHVTNNK